MKIDMNKEYNPVLEETDDFNTYMDQNPRMSFPNEEMKQFLNYAISRFIDHVGS